MEVTQQMELTAYHENQIPVLASTRRENQVYFHQPPTSSILIYLIGKLSSFGRNASRLCGLEKCIESHTKWDGS